MVNILWTELESQFKAGHEGYKEMFSDQHDLRSVGVQILSQPGRTSLDADLEVLARHAAPDDCKVYAFCRAVYRMVCPALCRS